MCVADTTPHTRAPRSVAVVDDDVRIRTLLRLELEDLGAVVLCFSSAKEALNGISNQSVDLVLLDVGLPEMDGITCLRLLRQQGLATKVVLMSGHWDPADEEEVRDAGADGYVVKTGLPALLADLMELAR
jgi:two-component system KDP operon response regulator KdpE